MYCQSCNRPLSSTQSLARGLGPDCARKQDRIAEEKDNAIDLEFDPVRMDIVCKRDEDGTPHFNIYPVIRHHSPDGFEWGYAGSGPTDFALNVLDLFLRHEGYKPNISITNHVIKNGKRVAPFRKKVVYKAIQWRGQFRDRFIATLPKKGGTVTGKRIRNWIHENIGGGTEKRVVRRESDG